jgi:hypothetical protein
MQFTYIQKSATILILSATRRILLKGRNNYRNLKSIYLLIYYLKAGLLLSFHNIKATVSKILNN